jgi:myo-inositol-1(or 4)-monophosphatase
MDLTQLHEGVLKILKTAEGMLLDGFFGEFSVDFKGGDSHSYGIVTAVDRALDALLKQELLKLLPDAGWISEETEANRPGLWSWIVDPIDGTLNFSKKIPVCGISIALWEGDQPRYGVVSFPLQKEQVHAIAGQGAFVNGVRVKGSGAVVTRDPYWLCSYYLDDEESRIPALTARIGTPYRRMDCATYEMVMAALGRAQGCLLGGQAIWDIGAAYLIAQESGRKVRFISPWPHLAGEGARAYGHVVATGDDAFIASIDAVM